MSPEWHQEGKPKELRGWTQLKTGPILCVRNFQDIAWQQHFEPRLLSHLAIKDKGCPTKRVRADDDQLGQIAQRCENFGLQASFSHRFTLSEWGGGANVFLMWVYTGKPLTWVKMPPFPNNHNPNGNGILVCAPKWICCLILLFSARWNHGVLSAVLNAWTKRRLGVKSPKISCY